MTASGPEPERAAQHAVAPGGEAISQQGSRDALWQRWTDNIEQVRQIADGLIERADIDAVEGLAGRFLAGRSALLEARVSGGHVVDGHGDLLAADIFCLADGPRILDCLEFDDKLRWLDGLDDAAFLAMDLERLGADELAGQFLDWYVEFSGDPAPASLRHHYVAYRAFVRAIAGCIRARQADRLAGQEASQLAALTPRQLRSGAVTVVLVGGLPGTGKSALAGALAGRLGWTVLSSDRIRKELAGITAAQGAHPGYGLGIYAPSWTERTYAELVHRAAGLTAHGESVILDATWVSAEHRAAAAAMADQSAADLVQLRCAAPPAVTQERIRRRTDSLSDAYPQVASKMAQAQAPWPEAVTIDTGSSEQDPATVLGQALGALGRPAAPA